jgi:RimJ/RimL family protein N-acetyltransferase
VKELETARLTLRPFTGDDLDAIYAVLSRPEVWRYDPGRPRSHADTQGMLNQWISDAQRDGFGRYAVVLRETGEVIGYSGLQWLLLDHGIYKSPEVELFYALAPEFWGQGYITEAAQAIIHFAFDDVKLRRVVSTAIGPNARSMSVMRRVGMQVITDPFEPDWVVGIIDNPAVEARTPVLATSITR